MNDDLVFTTCLDLRVEPRHDNKLTAGRNWTQVEMHRCSLKKGLGTMNGNERGGSERREEERGWFEQPRKGGMQLSDRDESNYPGTDSPLSNPCWSPATRYYSMEGIWVSQFFNSLDFGGDSYSNQQQTK